MQTDVLIRRNIMKFDYISDMLSHGLLDGARVEKCDHGGLYIYPDWERYFKKGEFEKDLLCRYVLLDLGGDPIKNDPENLSVTAPYFYVSVDEIHTGRYSTKTGEQQTFVYLYGADDEEYQVVYIYFKKLLT
jgi:hypothetical protein